MTTKETRKAGLCCHCHKVMVIGGYCSLCRKRRQDIFRLIVIHHYSKGKRCCACCGEKQIPFLGIDHVNGGGKKNRGKNKGQAFYRYLIKSGFPSDPPLQVLCHNCNLAKGFYGKCPHQC